MRRSLRSPLLNTRIISAQPLKRIFLVWLTAALLCTANLAVAGSHQIRVWGGSQNLYVPRIGRVTLRFPSVSSDTSSSQGIKVQRLTGIVAGSQERVVVSYSTANIKTIASSGNVLSREILFSVRSPRTGRLTYVRATFADPKEALKVISVPSTLLSSARCGSKEDSVLHSNLHANAHSSATINSSSSKPFIRRSSITIASGPKIKVAFVADSLYNRRFGNRTEQHVMTMLDQVNVIYERDLGLNITPILLAREKISSASLSQNDSSGLLDGFSVLVGKARYGEANVYHLLTGKDLSDNIIGLANLPGACAPSRSIRVSLSQYLNPAVDYMTIAHEIGHNLGAEHDTTTSPATLMYPSLPVDSVKFSSRSVQEISVFKSYSDIRRCLGSRVASRNSLSINPSVGAKGSTVLEISLPTDQGSCSLQLQASPTKNFSNSSKLSLASSESLSLRIFSLINRRPNRDNRINIRVTANCNGTEFVAQKTVSPSALSKSLISVSQQEWANLFVASFR